MKSKLEKLLAEPSSSGEPAAAQTQQPEAAAAKPEPKPEPKAKPAAVNDALRAARSKRKGKPNDDKKPTDGNARGFNILRPGTWSRDLW